MFYSTRKVFVSTMNMDWGKYRYIQYGMFGKKGRKPINIMVPDDCVDTVIDKNVTYPYSIVMSQSNKPKLITKERESVFLAIDTLGEVDSKNGEIQILDNEKDRIKVLSYGLGAFGENKIMCLAPACLLEVTAPVIIVYRTTRVGFEAIYVQSNKEIMHFPSAEEMFYISVEYFRSLHEEMNRGTFVDIMAMIPNVSVKID